jgi:putative glutamine amidotransferase
VNSVHYQGVDRLAAGMMVEAVAPDGTIEAIRLFTGSGFALGVQWHPETDWQTDHISRKIFAAYAEALHAPATSAMAAD